jgi:ketosteroid isomerase-like protein
LYRRSFAVALMLGSAACTVEPTPREFIDRQVLAAEAHAQAEAALQDQVRHLIEAIQAGDAEAAREAFTAAADVVVVGPGEHERLDGAAQADALVELAAAVQAGTLELRELQVDMAPRGNVGWFSAVLELRRAADAFPVPLRVTGVYVEREAVWELQQAHLSVPSDVLTAPAAYPQAPSPPAGAG